MAFKEIKTTLDGFFPAKKDERKEGESVTGTYVGTRQIANKKGEVNICYILETEDGKKIGVNDYTCIASAFAEINLGKLVRITYLGKKDAKDGGSYNDFKIEVDE